MFGTSMCGSSRGSCEGTLDINIFQKTSSIKSYSVIFWIRHIDSSGAAKEWDIWLLSHLCWQGSGSDNNDAGSVFFQTRQFFVKCKKETGRCFDVCWLEYRLNYLVMRLLKTFGGPNSDWQKSHFIFYGEFVMLKLWPLWKLTSRPGEKWKWRQEEGGERKTGDMDGWMDGWMVW